MQQQAVGAPTGVRAVVSWHRYLVVAVATAILSSWGALTWAGGQALGMAPTSPDGFNALLTIGLVVGVAGAMASAAWLLVGWSPASWLATWAAALLSRPHRRMAALVYMTPIFAHAVCLAAAEPVVSDGPWLAVASAGAGLPSLLLCGAHWWLIAPGPMATNSAKTP